ncbi:MAG: STAS domain-containing protein [Bacteroidia bacterium]
MEIKEFQESGYITLLPVGDLDAQSSIDMDSCMRRHIDGGNVKLHIDGSRLAYISSAGLGVFISHLDEVESAGGQLVFSSLSEEVKDVFDLLGLSRLVTIVNKSEAAAPLFES